MSPPPPDLASRRAQIRAIAAAIVDTPPMASRFRIAAGVVLQPSARSRSSGRQPRAPALAARRSPTFRRVAAATFLLLQLGVLVALFTAPAFKVSAVEVSGDRLLGRATLLAAARVPQSSLFAVDSEGIRTRLSQVAWVRSVSVTTQLPATVHINVTEWQPDIVVRRGRGDVFVAATGATLPRDLTDATAAAGLPLLLDDRSVTSPLPQGLPDLLATIAQRWPSVFGGRVSAFVWGGGGVLSIWTAAGWQAVLGHVDSGQALAGVPNQLAVLAALRGKVDFVHPTYGYVDLENASEPAIGGKPGMPAGLTAEIAGGSSAGPSADAQPVTTTPAAPVVVATPTPLPTPRPSPTPLVLGLAPISPTASPGR